MMFGFQIEDEEEVETVSVICSPFFYHRCASGQSPTWMFYNCFLCSSSAMVHDKISDKLTGAFEWNITAGLLFLSSNG